MADESRLKRTKFGSLKRTKVEMLKQKKHFDNGNGNKSLQEFAIQHQLKQVIPQHQPKQNMPATYCIDNSIRYCDEVSGWEPAAGYTWCWNTLSMTAHCWVHKRKKHREITQVPFISASFYLHSNQLTQSIMKYKEDLSIMEHDIWNSYYYDMGKWIPDTFRWD